MKTSSQRRPRFAPFRAPFRAPRSTPLWACLSVLAAGLGCGDTTTPNATTFSFDRPVDVAFGCFGSLRLTSGGEPIVSAMPTTACATRATPRELNNLPLNVPGGQDGIGSDAVDWYALVLESGPGTVHVAQFDIQFPKASFSSLLPDSDPLTPGQNGISVGEEPVAIVTDPAGCHAVTANAGSCDLSVLDLNSVFDGARGAQVDRLEVKNGANGTIHARPAAMVGEPPSSDIGNACPVRPTGLVYVAYPSCHLVAGIDTATGTVVTGIQYGATGAPTIVGGNVTCPDECGGGGGGGVSPGVRPVALDLEVDPGSSKRRLAIGADNSSAITIVELDDASRPMTVAQVQLEDPTGKLGVSAIALTQEIGMGGGMPGVLDPINDEASIATAQFVYAVATDRSVRVADVYAVPKECDTQIDPRFTRGITDLSLLSCFPVGATTNPPRRVGARGPGIRLPGDAIPLAVDFARVPRLQAPDSNTNNPQPDVPEFRTNNPEQPLTLVGDFAVITSSNGGTYLANVDDDDFPDVFDPGRPLLVPMPLAMAHQLRDRVGSRSLSIDEDRPYEMPPEGAPTDFDDHSSDDLSCDYNGRFDGTTAIGGPRITAAPDRKAPADLVVDAKLVGLPRLRQLECNREALHGSKKVAADHKVITELQYAADNPTRDAAFPDLMALPEAETWTMVWEGSLSLNAGDSSAGGPAIRESLLRVDSLGVHIVDDGKPFCDAGVERYDIVQLRGCDPTLGASDCPSGYTCFVHPDSKIAGLGACMLADEADRLANACRDFLISSRRYTVDTASTGELLAIPRRYELSTTPVDGCVSSEQCETLAEYAETLSGARPLSEACNHNGTCDSGESNLWCSDDCTRPCNNNGTCDAGERFAWCPSDCSAGWACVRDSARAPRAGTGDRCELRCETTDDCQTGTVCQAGFCMEGVTPPQACINSSQRYELHAGEAFAVIGSLSGFVHPIVAGAANQCVRDPVASRLAIGRLPLVPRDAAGAVQVCTGAANEPNPCATTAETTDEFTSNKDPVTCKVPEGQTPTVNFKKRLAPAVRFRNRGMTFTMVDPYSPGDLTCNPDRAGGLGQIPQVVPGYTMSFRLVGGFAPQQVFDKLSTDRPSLPIKVVKGPADTVWIVDAGDFLSSTTGTASTRGKVLRLDPLVPTLGGAVTNASVQ
jgi:hypothetical protein